VLSIPSTMRVFAYAKATDMRKSFDGLVGLARNVIKEDPLSGHLFVFFNRRFTMMKAVHWDRNGYALFAKRLERGTFIMPKTRADGVIEIEAVELALILEGIDLSGGPRRPRWAPAPAPL